MMQSNHVRGTLTLLLTVAGIVGGGCGPGRPTIVPISGSVTLDGKPVPQATVLFIPVAGGVPARGSTREDGGFTLTTFAEGDGAIAGKHRVAVSKMKVTGIEATEDGMVPATVSGDMRTIWVTPQKYAEATTSGLEVDVARGMAPVALALESK
ncbi:MAG: hypothetical protein ACKO40_05910 [Planctomycetaceae bacterium]